MESHAVYHLPFEIGDEDDGVMDPVKFMRIAKELMLKLGNLDSMDFDESLTTNISTFAEFLSDEVENLFEELSALFVKICCQLSIQVPIVVSVVYKMHEQHPHFGKYFLVKLQNTFVEELRNDHVAVCRLLLRALACFASAKVLAISGEGSFGGLLETFLAPLEQENQQRKRSNTTHNLSDQGQVLAYLLSSTLPWCLNAFPTSSTVVSRIESVLTDLLQNYVCPFGANGRQAMLFRYTPPDDGMQFVGLYEHNEHSNGATDTLMESIKVCLSFIPQWKQTTSDFTLPSCMLMPWKIFHAEANDVNSLEVITLRSDLNNVIGDELIKRQQVLGQRSRFCKPQDGVFSIIGDAASGSGRYFSWLRGRIPLFASDSCGESEVLIGALTPSERFMIMSYYQDILMFFDPIINSNGTYTGTVDTLIEQLLSVNKIFLIKLNDENQTSKSNEKGQYVEYLLGEVLFNLILQQPMNTALTTQASRVILTLCKRSTIFPTIVSLATNLIFNILPDLDFSSIYSFSQWFAFHFVNAQYSWPYWSHWETECGLLSLQRQQHGTNDDRDNEDDEMKQHSGRGERNGNDDENDHDDENITDAERLFRNYGQLFLRFILNRCSNIARIDILKEKIPSSFHSFLIHDNRPHWYYLKNSNEITLPIEGFEYLTPTITTDMKLIANKILIMIIDKHENANGLLDYLETIPSFVIDDDCHKQILLQIFIECLLEASYRNDTLTALFNYLIRYYEVFLQLADNEENQIILIRTILMLYCNNGMMQLLIIDRLVRDYVISSTALVNYLTREMNENDNLLIRLANGSVSSSILSLFHIVIDRSLDNLKTMIIRRKELGDGLQLHEQVDLTPSPMPIDTTATTTTANDEDGDDDDHQRDDDDDDEHDNGRRRTRRRLNEDGDADNNDRMQDNGETSGDVMTASNNGITDTSVLPSSSAEITLWTADEAVKRCLRNTRSVYQVLMSYFAQVLQKNANNNISISFSSALDIELNIVKSLLLRTLRIYLGNERFLSKDLMMEVVLTDRKATREMFVVLEKVNPAIAASWKELL